MENKNTIIPAGAFSIILAGYYCWSGGGRFSINAINFESSKSEVKIDGNRFLDQIKGMLPSSTDYKELYDKTFLELKYTKGVINLKDEMIKKLENGNAANATNIKIMQNITDGITINLSKLELTVSIVCLCFIIGALVNLFQSISETNQHLLRLKDVKIKSLRNVRDADPIALEPRFSEQVLQNIEDSMLLESNKRLEEWKSKVLDNMEKARIQRDKAIIYRTMHRVSSDIIKPMCSKTIEQKTIALAPIDLRYRSAFDAAMKTLSETTTSNILCARMNASVRTSGNCKVKNFISPARSIDLIPLDSIQSSEVDPSRKFYKVFRHQRNTFYTIHDLLDRKYDEFSDGNLHK